MFDPSEMEIIDAIEPIDCSQCSYRAPSLNMLVHHIQRNHENFCAGDLELLYEHYQQERIPRIETDEIGSFCEDIGRYSCGLPEYESDYGLPNRHHHLYGEVPSRMPQDFLEDAEELHVADARISQDSEVYEELLPLDSPRVISWEHLLLGKNETRVSQTEPLLPDVLAKYIERWFLDETIWRPQPITPTGVETLMPPNSEFKQRTSESHELDELLMDSDEIPPEKPEPTVTAFTKPGYETKLDQMSQMEPLLPSDVHVLSEQHRLLNETVPLPPTVPPTGIETLMPVNSEFKEPTSKSHGLDEAQMSSDEIPPEKSEPTAKVSTRGRYQTGRLHRMSEEERNREVDRNRMRVRHNECERKRRQRQSELCDQLLDMLPATLLPKGRVTQQTVLKVAATILTDYRVPHENLGMDYSNTTIFEEKKELNCVRDRWESYLNEALGKESEQSVSSQ